MPRKRRAAAVKGRMDAPRRRKRKTVHDRWRERVEKTQQWLADLELMAEWENEDWIRSMRRHYRAELERLLAHEPPADR